MDTTAALDQLRRRAPYAIATAFAASSVLHLLRPRVFRTLIPPQLPNPDAWVYASGVAEATCAAGLFTRQPWAGPATAAVLLGVLPGNVQMALDAGSGRNRGVADNKVLAWARVPLQAPMIWAALQNRPTQRG